jgi:hypothetical protein
VLDEAGVDQFCEARCRKFYHDELGRPSLAPGMNLVWRPDKSCDSTCY